MYFVWCDVAKVKHFSGMKVNMRIKIGKIELIKFSPIFSVFLIYFLTLKSVRSLKFSNFGGHLPALSLIRDCGNRRKIELHLNQSKRSSI